MDGARPTRVHWILVAFLTAAGMALRLAYLLKVPPFLDEYSSILTGMSILRTGGVPRLPSGVLYPSGSLFSYLEATFIGTLGFSDNIARLPSLLVSGLTLPILFVVAQRLFSSRIALLSMALLAFTPEAVVWGGRARMYALLQLLVLVTVYFFYRSVLEDRGANPARRIRPFLWVAFFIAAIFAQDEAILLLPVFLLGAVVVQGPRWLLRRSVVLLQIGLPVAGVAARYWLNEIRVPGEVYVGVHASFFRFPPSLAHGLSQVAPFFLSPWAWPLSLFFAVAIGLLLRQTITTQGQANVGTRIRCLSGLMSRSPLFFLSYVFLAIVAALTLVVNTPWQDKRYLFMVMPLFLMVAASGLEQIVDILTRRWPTLGSQWTTVALVLFVAGVSLPAGLSALQRSEPDYSAAYRWLQPQLDSKDLIATVRPAPAAVYLGRSDFLVSEDKYQEFVMRIDGVWVDRWTGAKVLDSPEAFRDEALKSGKRVWFVIDEDRFESVRYSPEFVGLVTAEMDLVWRQGGVLIFEGQGYHPPPQMEVTQTIDANFEDQVRLVSYALSSDQPEPGQELVLQLFWQAIRPERNYTVFVHLVSIDGNGLTQIDGEPFLGLYGMSTHWPRDRAVVDQRVLLIPKDTAPGRYRLEVGLYDGTDSAASLLQLPDGTTNLVLDYLRIGTLALPKPSQTVDMGDLGGAVRLEGYEPPLPGGLRAGGSLTLTLTWQCLDTMEEDYTVFVHLTGADEQPVAQADGQPVGGSYPTQFWEVGERVADPRFLDIPGTVSPGEYQLRVGMYLLATGDRLPLLDADGSIMGDSILLGKIEVTP